MFYSLQGAPLDGGNTAEINYQWNDSYSMANQLTNENSNPSPTLPQNSSNDFPLQSQEYQGGTQNYSLETNMTNQLGADALSYNPNIDIKPPAKPSLSEIDNTAQHQRNIKSRNKYPMNMEQFEQDKENIEEIEEEDDDEEEDEELMKPENSEDNMLLLLIGLGILLIAYLLYRNGFQF